MQKMRVWSLGQEDLLEATWQPIPVFLPEECHGQRSLAGSSPWGCKDWKWLKRLSMHACIANLQIRKFPFGSLYTSWKHLSCFTDTRLSEAVQNYVLHFYGHALYPNGHFSHDISTIACNSLVSSLMVELLIMDAWCRKNSKHIGFSFSYITMSAGL